MTRWEPPSGPGIRVDSGVAAGTVVGGQFDSLLAKLVVTGADRRQALARARRALAEFRVEGLPTVLPFHRAVVEDPAFVALDGLGVHTRWIETEFAAATPPADGGDPDGTTVTIQVGGRAHVVALPGLAALDPATAGSVRRSAAERGVRAGTALSGDGVPAPMQGTVVRIAVADGDRVRRGDLVAVVEAMKMENPVTAHKDGVVAGIAAAPGASVGQGAVLCRIEG
ncbi:MAG: biotin/lipoyl-binding protein [Pseudonocardiales bacterium]|nr:biotin/lipoyl-binding protein [Pseudonocardiales bacterium]